jgi:hypothetical protein
MPSGQAVEPMSGQNAAQLVELARSCRAATRAVSLYPTEHPAIRASLARLSGICERALEAGPWFLTVTPSEILLGGRRLPRPDAGVGELADLLHGHQIGQLVVHGGADGELWLKFVRLLATPIEDLQRQGGIARVWATTGGRPIEIREVDYGAVLRERESGDEASWDLILKNCLQGDSVDLDEGALRMLAELAGNPDKLAELARRLEEQGAEEGAVRTAAAALLAVLRSVIEMIARTEPDRLDPILTSMTLAAGRFSPDIMMELLASRGENGAAPSIDLAGEILARLNDTRIAGFVANSVIVSRGATARLAEAFLALVPEPDRRHHLLGLAREEVATSPLGGDKEFDRLWQGVEDLLGSYTDEAYVSKDYAQELTTARTKATEIDVITDDPPDRIAAWLATVSDAAVRALDLQLLLDLLTREGDGIRWREISELVVTHVDDLLLVGDFAAAAQLVSGLAAVTVDDTQTGRQPAALVAIDRLINGQALVHIVYHLQAIDDEDFRHVKALCLSLGAGVIRPLAEMLAAQERARVRQRLTDLLLAFGVLGRQSAEQLKSSPNPSVRRVAVHLLREFGGREALPDLESLLDDAEPHVQRDAVRAILLIGTDDAYSVLERALRSGSAQSRDTILHQLDTAGDERAAPLFSYIVRRGDYRKALRPIYLRAVGALGRFGSDEAIDALKLGLYRGEWWAPFRTAVLRAAAARSLRQIGTPPAMEVLLEATERGPRGVRAAARPQLARAPKNGEGKRPESHVNNGQTGMPSP